VKESSMAYDPKEHRYVNAPNLPGSASRESLAERERVPSPARDGRNNVDGVPRTSARTTVAPPRNSVPPPVPRYSGGGERSSVGGSHGSWGGWSGSSAAGGSVHSAPAPSASHGSSGGGGSHGRP